MIEFIKTYIVSLIVIGIIGIPVISQIMSPMWKNMIENIQVSEFVVKKYSAFIAYILLALGLSVYSIPKISEDNILGDSIIYGGLLGLIIYGVFDFTNLAIINKYNLKIAIIDTIWGGILFTLAGFISKKVLIKLKDIV